MACPNTPHIKTLSCHCHSPGMSPHQNAHTQKADTLLSADLNSNHGGVRSWIALCPMTRCPQRVRISSSGLFEAPSRANCPQVRRTENTHLSCVQFLSDPTRLEAFQTQTQNRSVLAPSNRIGLFPLVPQNRSVSNCTVFKTQMQLNRKR